LSGSGAVEWQCPGCDHLQAVDLATTGAAVDLCAICGNHELYKKKNFPHWLGISILAAASLCFLVLNAVYWQWLAWAVLIGSALIDGILYLMVSDVIVCYRCGARYSGFPTGSSHSPFELTVAERYRQERLRKQ
jgi:hypothetical protein